MSPVVYPSRVVMSHEEYNKQDAVRSTGLRTLLELSAEHYLHNLKFPKPPTAPMERGTKFHEAILEPEKFRQNAVVMPEFSGTGSRAAKESWLQDNHNKTIVKAEELADIEGVLNKIKIHKTATSYLSKGTAEGSLFWIDPETKIALKARPDFFKDNHILIDIKTTEKKVDFFSVQKEISNRNLHIQAALYLDGATEIVGTKFDEFVFIFIETHAPYGISCVLLTDEAVQEGRAQYQQALKILKKCRETGIYPGYPDETKPIWLPSWAIKGDDNE